MKAIYIAITAGLLCGHIMQAQGNDNQVARQITEEILPQLPADNQETYNRLMDRLIETGSQSVAVLVAKLTFNGENSDTQAEYALSGLTHYAAGVQDDLLRRKVTEGYITALGRTEDREVKAFIVRQLQILGGDESVEALARYLTNAQLSGSAARALATIGTAKAQQALQAALLRKAGTLKTQQDVVLAIGQARLAVPEDLIAGMLQTEDADMRKTVLYTLGRIGGKASLNTLQVAAQRVNYMEDNTGATQAYISLIDRMAREGDAKTAAKAAKELAKSVAKAGAEQTRRAALGLLFAAEPDKQRSSLLLSALKDGSREYRTAALNFAFASVQDEKALYIETIKAMIKAKPWVKTDILNRIALECDIKEKRDFLKTLDLRFDLPARQALLAEIGNKDPEVKQAAAWVAVKLGDEAAIPLLVNLLGSENISDIALGKESLASFNGEIYKAVAKALPALPEKGRVTGLELLALRRADAALNTVLEQTKSDSDAVKQTAYAVLKEVVSEKDFILLCGMLETASRETVAPLQQAVMASLAGQSPDQRVNTLEQRMIQAGQSKKHLYYLALSTTGERQALQTIVDGFQNSTTEAKESAFEALLNWEGVEAMDQLYAICTDASLTNYFDRSLAAYVRLASDPAMTGENCLLFLRKAMEVARTDEQRNRILTRIERTGTFLALLYAGQYLDKLSLQQAAANAVMNIALNHPQYTGQAVRELLTKAMSVLDNPDAEYQRQAIRKHLDEMPKEEGFVSLFNGKDLTGWKGLVENPIARKKMTAVRLSKAQAKADEQMRKDWKVENGCLVFDGAGYDNLCTEKQYGDFEMYLDWLLDPSGKEADAGVYLRGTPQVQMWDTARVNAGAQVGSGGLYNNRNNPSKPLVVADNRLGEWNTMYIKMTGDRVTVILNGQTVTDQVILENFWDSNLPIFTVEQIELQAHGSKVYYRNLYIKEL